jgi:predicted membrane protein
MGVGIVLFVIGAILEFALRIDVTWIDVHLVGYILMIAGAVVFLLSLILLLVRRGRRTGPVNDEELL